MGPLNQCKKMFSPTRVVATVLMFVCLALTLLSAFLVSLCILQSTITVSGFNKLFCLVEKEWISSTVLHHSVFGHDLVLFVIHSVCTRFSEENRVDLHGINRPASDKTTPVFPLFCTAVNLIFLFFYVESAFLYCSFVLHIITLGVLVFQPY